MQQLLGHLKLLKDMKEVFNKAGEKKEKETKQKKNKKNTQPAVIYPETESFGNDLKTFWQGLKGHCVELCSCIQKAVTARSKLSEIHLNL